MSNGAQEELAHLEQQIAIKTKRLRILTTQIAHYNHRDIPPHLLIEQENLEREVKQLRDERKRSYPTAFADDAPYLGLKTFQEDDAHLFYGRDSLIELLVEKGKDEPFLAVLGPSGSGKSSVVLAGLLPALKRGDLAGSQGWHYLTFKPGLRPLDTLEAAMVKMLGDDITSVLLLRDELRKTDQALLRAADRLVVGQNGARFVLVIDQFEELWTQMPTESEARTAFIAEHHQPFINLLLTAAAASGSPVLIILTMRADFLHRAAEQRDLARLIGDHLVIVSPMVRDELGEAIERPAHAAGGDFEPGLVDELIKQVENRAGALPLLEYTLLELWKAKRPDGTMTWDAFRSVGGVEGALAARADQILEQHYKTPAQRDELRAILLRLVQPGEGVADTRRRALLDDLVPADGSVEALQLVLKPLADERLLTTGRDERGAETVEVSHEALISAWPTFNAWIVEARDDLRLQLQLEEAAKEWRTSGENADFLWSGLRLANVEAWIERAQPRLNERDVRFVRASHKREQQQVAAREQARRREIARLRTFLGVGTVLLLVAVGLTAYAFNQQQIAAHALVQAQKDRNAAQDAVQKEAEASTRAQHEARISKAQANAGEALYELARHNDDRALLLARAAILRDTQVYPILTVRALRETNQQTTASILLEDHTSDVIGSVSAVAWNPDGTQVLTGSYDKTARIWDAATGTLVRSLDGHTGTVTAVAWNPDGTQVLTGSYDKTARIWDAATGTLVRSLDGHTDAVSAVAWSPDGTQVLTGSYDKTARIWDAATGTLVRSLDGHTDAVSAVAWSPDGTQVLTGSADSTARIWDAATGTLVRSLDGHTDPVSAVAWSPDGTQVLTGSSATTARIWDAATGTLVRPFEGHTDAVSAVAWSPDGTQVLTGSDDNTARIWDAATGTLVRPFESHTGTVTAVAWSPDGTQVLTGSYDKTARIWDAATGTLVRQLDGHTDAVTAVAWNPDGTQVLTGSYDKTARIWDAATGTLVRQLDGHTDAVTAVAWNPDGTQVLTGSWDSTARIWDAATGTLVRPFESHTGTVTAVAWNPDGTQVLTGSYDKTAHIWDAATGTLVRSLDGHSGWVSTVAWSPDGTQVLIGSGDNTARIWDTATGTLVRPFEGHTGTVTAVAWSPDGTQVLTGSSDTTARMWIAEDRPIIAELTRRVCNIFDDDEIRVEIPEWRGCAAELATVKNALAEYDRLRGAP